MQLFCYYCNIFTLFLFPADKLFRSKGAVLRDTLSDSLTVEAVQRKWGQILDMSEPDSPDSPEEAMGKFMEALRTQESGSALKNVTRSTLAGISFPEVKHKYNKTDSILYSLGCELN